MSTSRAELREVIIATLKALPGLNIPVDTDTKLQYDENAERILDGLTDGKLQALYDGIQFASGNREIRQLMQSPAAAPHPSGMDGDSF